MLKRLFIATVFIFISSFSFAEEITVPGVSGITFDDENPSVTITEDFQMYGLTISPNGLTMMYENNTFTLYGDVVFSIANQSITASLVTMKSLDLL